MPHIEMPHQRDVRELGKERSFVKQSQVIGILEKKDVMKEIGSGAECIVTEVKGHPELVAAYAYYGIEPFDAKAYFYRHRILSTLFPRNFPGFVAAFATNTSQNSLRLGGTLRRRIAGEISVQRQKSAFPFSEAKKKMAEMGFSPQIDTGYVNFMRGHDGGEYYVDTVKGLFDFDLSKVLLYMRSHGYSDVDIHVVESSARRLQQLRKERAKEYGAEFVGESAVL